MAFEIAGRCAGINMNDAATLLSFAQGLPTRLLVRFIDIDSSENLEHWADAAQKHQKNWIKKLSIDDDYNAVSHATKKVSESRRQTGAGNASKTSIGPGESLGDTHSLALRHRRDERQRSCRLQRTRLVFRLTRTSFQIRKS